jgi:aspartate racemase
MHNGNVNRWRVMIKHLGNDQPVYAIQPLGLDVNQEPHRTIEEMADYYLDIVKSVQPKGPYHFIGLCFSGMVVYEMAARLQQQGEQVKFLGMVNNYAPAENALLYRVQTGMHKFLQMETSEKINYAFNKARFIGDKLLVTAKLKSPDRHHGVEEIQIDEPTEEIGHDLRTIHSLALLHYHPAIRYDGNLVIFRNSGPVEYPYNEYLGWDRLVSGSIRHHIIEGSDNDTIITDEPYNAVLSCIVRDYLEGRLT